MNIHSNPQTHDKLSTQLNLYSTSAELKVIIHAFTPLITTISIWNFSKIIVLNSEQFKENVKH